MIGGLKRLLENPGIAILRGVTPDEVLAVGAVLLDAGFKVIQVPLNAQFAMSNTAKLAQRFGQRVRVGVGTVL